MDAAFVLGERFNKKVTWQHPAGHSFGAREEKYIDTAEREETRGNSPVGQPKFAIAETYLGYRKFQS